MKREYNEIGNTVDPSLKFWFKGEQGRLVDEISGSSIIINGNLMSWDSTRQAYKVAFSNSYTYSAYCTPCDLGTTEWNHTVVVDVWPIAKGSDVYITTLDTYPTRQAWAGFTYNRLTQNVWNRCAMVYTKVSNSLVERRGYINGDLDISVDYINPNTFNKGTGVMINARGGNPIYIFGTYYFKNMRFYNRPLTLDKIAAL